MHILKFGGSSVGSPFIIEKVIKIILTSQQQNKEIVVVVSAWQGVTDQLIKMAKLAEESKEEYLEELQQLEKRHLEGVKALIPIKTQSGILAQVKMRLNELEDILNGVFLVKELTSHTLDFVMSFGERLSAYILSECLKSRGTPSIFVDTRDLIKTDENFGMAHVYFSETNQNLQHFWEKIKGIPIVTGFIGSNLKNETTTLGRGGSDYTASILGAALKAKEVEIWTDVDGVMTANPKQVKKAFTLPAMTYEEAMELSHFGAKVIYPPTMQPAMEKKIPLRIRNTFNPDAPGTVITDQVPASTHLIQGISSIKEVALIRVEGSGMVGVTGVAMRIFSALAKEKINVILISQASSEHTVCFAVLPAEADKAKICLAKEFALEIHLKQLEGIIIEKELSIIAIVGENMRRQPGISAKLFQALGKNGINVVAIAQGSSELNISVVINRKDEIKALNAIHDAFFLSQTRTLNLFLVGTGLIGGTLLSQIKKQAAFLSKEYALDLKVMAVANSQKMLFNSDGINLETFEQELNHSKTKTNLTSFVARMQQMNLPNSVFVDCTASEEVVAHYQKILASAISIVTPNKKANSLDYAFYKSLHELAQKYGVKFLYDTNVGAGLPVISTLHDLQISGDKINKIEAVLSGTISYLFNNLSSQKTFSAVLKEAQEKGFTEPDPRDDLSGKDVARKILILARESGFQLELKEIKVENLLSADLLKITSIPEFYKQLKKEDKNWEKRREQADQQGKALRYLATLQNGQAQVSLTLVDKNHPAYNLSGSDNIISFSTERYFETPLVVKGSGAGAKVTAAGVFADIIKVGA